MKRGSEEGDAPQAGRLLVVHGNPLVAGQCEPTAHRLASGEGGREGMNDTGWKVDVHA